MSKVFINSRAYKDFLAGTTYKRSEQGYNNWRNTIPYTNEEIIAALLAYADALPEKESWLADNARFQAEGIRVTGKFSGTTLGIALNTLIKVCNVCGKKALYRRGNEGRCSAHRDMKEKFSEAKAVRLAEKSAAILDSKMRIDIIRSANEKLHRTKSKKVHK